MCTNSKDIVEYHPRHHPQGSNRTWNVINVYRNTNALSSCTAPKAHTASCGHRTDAIRVPNSYSVCFSLSLRLIITRQCLCVNPCLSVAFDVGRLATLLGLRISLPICIGKMFARALRDRACPCCILLICMPNRGRACCGLIILQHN